MVTRPLASRIVLSSWTRSRRGSARCRPSCPSGDRGSRPARAARRRAGHARRRRLAGRHRRAPDRPRCRPDRRRAGRRCSRDERVEVRRAGLLFPFDQEFDVDRQRARRLQPGSGGGDLGEDLPLVVARAAAEELAVAHRRLEWRAEPLVRADPAAARRSGRRSARSACPGAPSHSAKTTGWAGVGISRAVKPAPAKQVDEELGALRARRCSAR